MSEYSQEIMASLTDEERAALEEDDGDVERASGDDEQSAAGGADDASATGAGDKTDDEEGDGKDPNEGGDASASQGKNGDDGDKTAAAAADATARAGDGGNADAGKQPAGDAAAADAPQHADQIVPLLVAEAPADADAKLKEIGDKKAALVEQFDNGDITAKEYQTQLDVLGKQERELERAIDKAKIAAEMKQQQEMNAWLGQVKDFTSREHPEYSKSRVRWLALDSFVKEIANDPANASLDGREILRRAHERVVEDLGEAPGAAAGAGAKDDGKPDGRPMKGSKAEPPKTLAKVPAAENVDINESRWAAFDRLAATDPEALEEKLMKLSPAERDEYLSRA
ncbi:hypothetical protein [Burkholderia multivorans]|uniref:hypothetical protein n=1 Tax=Burkholderia multivorans TaxID=87883 RepID=UPI001C22C319|nr:hypothetical protein [Burkholderia multivorans]ULR75118.1 virion-associated protein [Burkholderia phage JC1]MBU9386632.1 hypothetical protein [Burkholderia multivorans]MBU9437066.1 hypothetical protein [Burkholderia multivorans]MBU9606271.1 hypothetical protein [Burkholderia multivorans]MBU9624830.1 hypothetical protein [Burkholderia multivorans]